MRVRVGNRLFDLIPGATGRHLLLAAFGRIPPGIEILDQWGNLLGDDGALSDGAVLAFRLKPKSGPEHDAVTPVAGTK